MIKHGVLKQIFQGNAFQTEKVGGKNQALEKYSQLQLQS
jgi:hypothetical protein